MVGLEGLHTTDHRTMALELLDYVFSVLDLLLSKCVHTVKIDSVGEVSLLLRWGLAEMWQVYVVAAGLFNDVPVSRFMGELVFMLLDACKCFETMVPLVGVRIGLHCGPVVSGVRELFLGLFNIFPPFRCRSDSDSGFWVDAASVSDLWRDRCVAC